MAAGDDFDNNGNLKRQEIYVPADGPSNPSVNVIQSYGYDALNRLTSVEEKFSNAAPSFSQAYAYYRFGNRTITAAGASDAPAMRYDAAGDLTYYSYLRRA